MFSSTKTLSIPYDAIEKAVGVICLNDSTICGKFGQSCLANNANQTQDNLSLYLLCTQLCVNPRYIFSVGNNTLRLQITYILCSVDTIFSM